MPILRANGLIGFVDGTNLCPSEFIIGDNGKINTKLNPRFYEWVQQDQNVLCWINATLSEGVLAHVIGLSTTRVIWLALEKRFSFMTKSHIIQLKTQLQSVKKGNQSITEYIQKIKTSSDNLASAIYPVRDEDLILSTLNGLLAEYGPFKTAITTRTDPINIEELHVLMLYEETNLDGEEHSVADFSSTALLASKQDSSKPMNYYSRGRFGTRGRGSRGFNNRGRESSSQSRPNHQQLSTSQSRQNFQSAKPCCQICNRSGHTDLDCYHRIDYSYQGNNPPSQLAATAMCLNLVPDPTWFANSGTANRVTNDMKNLSIHSDYQGNDTVSIVNGQGLKILKTGSSVVHTSNANFKLKNILHVLAISSNFVICQPIC